VSVKAKASLALLLQVLFASTATRDEERLSKKMRGVCSSFQQVVGATEPHGGKEFFPFSSKQSGVLGIHGSGHDSCSGLLSFPGQRAAVRPGQRVKSTTHL